MEVDKYLKLFVEESTEYIQLMNSYILNLEKNPNDERILNELYRCAHSIKGMSSAMGFVSLRNIAHSLEDIFDLLKKNKIKLNEIILNLLFESLDTLKKGIELSNKKQEIPSFKEIIEKLNAVSLSKDKEVIAEEKKENLPIVKEEIGTSYPFKYKIEVSISPDSIFPAARAMVIYNKLSSSGRIIKIDPSLEEIAKGKACFHLVLEYSTLLGKDEVEKEIKEITDVVNCSVYSAEIKKEVEEYEAEETKIGKFIPPSLKIDASELDKLHNIATELFIINEEFQEYKGALPSPLLKTSTEFNVLISQLLSGISKIRLLPLSVITANFPRMIREIAEKEKKKVKFISKGEDILIDKTIIENLADPLIHIIRNAVDHGIESPQDRLSLGKREEGIISFNATRESGRIKIVIIDDGKGMNLKRILEVAINKGLISHQKAQQMTTEEILNFITLPGFSTSSTVSEISGRGFGMDIVKSKVEALGGSIKIETRPKVGTKITLYIPLAISMIEAFIVECSNYKFAFPMAQIYKTFKIAKKDLHYIQSEPVAMLEEKPVFLKYLYKILNLSNNYPKEEYFILTTEIKDKLKGIIVDFILEQRKLIIKPLNNPLERLPYYQGVAVMSKGNMLPVLDLSKILSF